MMATISQLHPQPQPEQDGSGSVVSINTVARLVHPDRITHLVQIDQCVEALTPQQRWEMANRSQRTTAERRHRLLRPVLEAIGKGVSDRAAILNCIANIEARTLPRDILDIAKALSNGSKIAPSKATFHNWMTDYRNDGLPGLLTKHKGRIRKEKGWEIAALRLYHLPSKPGFAEVAFNLGRLGIESVTGKQVGSFINSLPAEYGPDSPWRVGKHFYIQNLGKHHIMDNSQLEVGELYQGDGHTCDAYIQHPVSGHIWRAELTIWIDVRSKYVAGWHLSKGESGETTLYALSHALTSNDHVPDGVHIDVGSGFVNQMTMAQTTGFFNRFHIKVRKAIPGNAKGKGLVERWFGIFRNRHDKFFNGGQDYCGHDQAAETNRRINDMIKQGKRQLRSFDEYRDSVGRYIEAYNSHPQKVLGGKTPAEMWATLERNPVEVPAAAIIRPQYTRMVRRLTVDIFNRKYSNDALSSYNGQEMIVEVDMHDDSRVWIYDAKHRLVCIAELRSKKANTTETVSGDRQKRREKGRLQRLQTKIDHVKAEESRAIDGPSTLEIIEELEVDSTPFIEHQPSDALDIDLDIDLTQHHDHHHIDLDLDED